VRLEGGSEQHKATGQAKPLYSKGRPSALFQLQRVTHTVFEGTEGTSEAGDPIHVRIESHALDEIRTVAGVHVAIVDVREYESGGARSAYL
jgi:hypothetical protein